MTLSSMDSDATTLMNRSLTFLVVSVSVLTYVIKFLRAPKTISYCYTSSFFSMPSSDLGIKKVHQVFLSS